MSLRVSSTFPPRSHEVAWRLPRSFCDAGCREGFITSWAAAPQLSCRNFRSAARPPCASASGCSRADESCREPPEIFTGRSKDRKARGESAFLFLEDQNQKYFPPRMEADEPAGDSASPIPLLALPIFRSSCEKSRSPEVAWIRHGSFCDSGCNLAAPIRQAGGSKGVMVPQGNWAFTL
jgi:hypothetical protein